MVDYSNSRMKALILEYVHSKRDRKILYLKLIDDIAISEIAEKFHLSDDRIKQIVSKEQRMLFRHYEEDQ